MKKIPAYTRRKLKKYKAKLENERRLDGIKSRAHRSRPRRQPMEGSM